MNRRENVLNQVKRMQFDVEELAERLVFGAEGVADSGLEMAMEERDPFEELQERERGRIVGEGIRGLEKIHEGREDEITPEEEFGLEAIVLLEGRPAILIQEGTFFPPPSDWKILEDHRSAINEVLSRVGRVEVDGHPRMEWVGTGFLVGANTIMTNRHVAREFGFRDGSEWKIEDGMSVRIDFREELGSAAALDFPVKQIIGVHEKLDLALLEIEDTSTLGQALPEPLAVALNEPPGFDGRQVYATGFPARDGRRNDPDEMNRIFSSIFNVKRLQPGELSDLRPDLPRIKHDCSTLGGNSGSPVVDLETHQVLGLHYGGLYLKANVAVPLWLLAGDPLLAAGHVNFQ